MWLTLFVILYKYTEDIAIVPIYLFPGNGTEGDRIVEQLAYIPPNVSSKPLKILLWQGLNQDVFGGKNPQEGDEIFHRESCLVTNCVLTEKRRERDEDLVIFRESEPFPPVRKIPGQLWMIFSLESPRHSYISGSRMDWTATYRRDSTIVAPYGAWRRYQARLKQPRVRDERFVVRKGVNRRTS